VRNGIESDLTGALVEDLKKKSLEKVSLARRVKKSRSVQGVVTMVSQDPHLASRISSQRTPLKKPNFLRFYDKSRIFVYTLWLFTGNNPRPGYESVWTVSMQCGFL
jgi:hypothetical protein